MPFIQYAVIPVNRPKNMTHTINNANEFIGTYGTAAIASKMLLPQYMPHYNGRCLPKEVYVIPNDVIGGNDKVVVRHQRLQSTFCKIQTLQIVCTHSNLKSTIIHHLARTMGGPVYWRGLRSAGSQNFLTS